MSGFGRDESVDSSGFRGIVPENTMIPVVVIGGDATLIKIKRGDNAGKTARIFKPVFECVIGKYRGARCYADIWCNVEPDPAGGAPDVFGSHMAFCDICDVTNVHEEDGSYPIAANEAEARAISQRFVGKLMLITVGVEEYPKRDSTIGVKNTFKSVTAMTNEQLEKSRESAGKILERVAKQKARKEANVGGSGLPDDDDDVPF